MMLLVDRHIGKTVLGAILIVLLAFGGITTLFPLIDELGDLDHDYGVREALAYVLLLMPQHLYELMPYVAFMGALVGLGALATNSELVVMRAAGISVRRIFASVVLSALPVMALTFAVGEWVAPWGEASGEALKVRAQHGGERARLGEGLWYREGHLFMSVNAVDAHGNLIGVQQYQIDDGRTLQWSRSAVGGHFVTMNGERYWLLEDVTETRFDTVRPLSQRHDVIRWDTEVDPQLLATSVLLEPRKLSLSDLHRQIAFLQAQGLGAERYELAFWSKLMQPLATLALIFVAVGFILGPLRERSMGTRIATGILVGLGFKYLQDLFAPMVMVYDLAAWLAVMIPIAACWIAGAGILRRVG
jgi:lipopolysaccharide export system permease protein